MLKNARLTPVYLSQMIELKEKDQGTWEVLRRGNFSVNKSSVPLSAVGADHELEQQNRALKVLGGIRGIANSQTALDKFFMTAEEVSLLLDQFADHYHLFNCRNTKEHYQLSGSKNKRISDNTQKLSQILDSHNLSFENTKNLYYVLTNKLMPNDQARRFLNAGGTGADKYKLFIEERLIGDKSIWDTISKEKIPTFVCNNKQITVTVNKELVNLKEERKLMSRFLAALRSRPGIDLSYYLGEFEQSAVPRSLFTVHRSFLKTRDKADVASEMRKLYSDEIERSMVTDDDLSQEKVIIFDAMAIVNKINIRKSKIKSCANLAEVFADRILDESFGYNEVRVIFDRYVKGLLKAQKRIRRTGGYSRVYRVHDETNIDNLETKEFLSSIETKTT